MKSKKILVALLTALMSICVAFGLTACGKHDTHTFSEDFKTSATQHWKECSCGEKAELADHVFGSGTIVGENVERTCTTCGYKKTEAAPNYSNAEILTNLANSTAIENGEGINVVLQSEKIDIEKINIAYYDGDYEAVWTLCDIDADFDFELFLGLDADGKLALNGAIALTATANNDADDSVFAVSAIKANILLKGSKFYTYMENASTYPGIPEELKEYNENEYSQSQVMDLDELFSSTAGDGQNLVSMIPGLMEEILPVLESFYDDNLKAAVESMIEESTDKVVDLIAKVVDYNMAIEKTADEIIVSFDEEKLLAQNNDLATKTLAQMFDQMYGEGAFAALEENIIGALDLTIDDVLMAIFTEEFTIEEVETLINTIIAIAYPEEEGPAPTLEDLIGTDIVGILNDEQFRSQGIFDLINESSEYPVDKEEVKTQIATYFDEFGGKTFYEIYENLTSVDMAVVKDVVDKVVGIMGDVFALDIILAADGAFKSLEASITVNNDIISDVMELISTEPEGDFGGYSDSELPFEGLDGKIVAKVTIGEFKNVMGVDYQEVIDKATEEAE